MNVLLSKGNYEYHIEENNEKIEKKTFGDIVAVSLICTYTLSAFIISGSSVFLLFTGNTNNGGLIGFIFNKMLSSLIA